MPRYGFKSLTIHGDIYDKLQEYAEELNKNKPDEEKESLASITEKAILTKITGTN